MISIEAWLEFQVPVITAHFRDDKIEVAAYLEEHLDIECRLEPQLEISANITEKYISLEE